MSKDMIRPAEFVITRFQWNNPIGVVATFGVYFPSIGIELYYMTLETGGRKDGQTLHLGYKATNKSKRLPEGKQEFCIRLTPDTYKSILEAVLKRLADETAKRGQGGNVALTDEMMRAVIDSSVSTSEIVVKEEPNA